jgi:acyl-CoA thioesterase
MDTETEAREAVDHAISSHPFADLIGLQMDGHYVDGSDCSLEVAPYLLNPHGVVHGAVLYALADTGMGGALMPNLEKGQICATIEIKFNYYHAVRGGTLRCNTTILNRGKSVANMESRLYVEDKLVASANGTYAIFTPSSRKGL